MTAVELHDVYAVYGEYKALNGLTVTVGEGEIITVLGRNGVGKSTMARVISGLVPVTAGQVLVLGRSVRRVSPSRVARRGVVHLPEGVGLFTGLSIEENLRLRVGGATRVIRRARLERALEGIGKPLRDRRRQRAGLLSGGEQRLVAISGAIAAEPKLLVADEPALGLSPVAAEAVYAALGALQSTHAAAIIIETRLGRVESLASRAVIMNGGVAVFDGSIDDAKLAMTQMLQPRADRSKLVPFDLSAVGHLRTGDQRDDPAAPR